MSLQEDLRLGFSILNSKTLGELATQMKGSQLLGLYRGAIPIVKVGPNDYLFGTTTKKVTVQKGQPQVRHEKRYISLLEYLHRCAREEFL